MTDRKVAELDAELEKDRKENFRLGKESDKIRRKIRISRDIVEIAKDREIDNLGQMGGPWSGRLSDQRYDGRTRTGKFARLQDHEGPTGKAKLKCSCGTYHIGTRRLVEEGFKCKCGKLTIPPQGLATRAKPRNGRRSQAKKNSVK